MSAADALIDRLPRTTLVVGKGGVGKTTCAAALGIRMASRAGSALVVSTDPARALPTVFEQPIRADATPIDGAPNLRAQVLDAAALRNRFLERWGAVLRIILDRGTYLDESDIGPLVDTALPGSDEIFSALELARLLSPSATDDAPNRVVVDTAPTGHTLRLLSLPQTFRALVRLLDAMQGKHRFMVRALTRSYRADAADAFLAEMSALASGLEQALNDPRRSGAVVIANTQPLVLEETRRYTTALRDLNVSVAAIIWNAVHEQADVEAAAAQLDVDVAQYVVPRLDEWPTGIPGLDHWMEALRPASSARPPKKAARRRVARPAAPPAANHPRIESLLRPLTIVAGKGGVGKTTVASALAFLAAERQRTLIVSTDPAPSLADALLQPVPDADAPISAAPALFARQMDASAAFARLRDEYQSRVDAVFDALVARGVDLSQDHAIARDLLALAPPGIDEVYALSLLADALFSDRYQCVIVDPAPTGHLLRLLEMPQLALAWTHQLMRLMLKYKDISGLGDTARELLAFSKNLRSLDELLRDASRCALVLVAIQEPVVVAETERLAAEVRARGVALSGVIHNRAMQRKGQKRAALPVADAPVHFEAPAVEPPPAGARALRDWIAAWRFVSGG